MKIARFQLVILLSASLALSAVSAPASAQLNQRPRELVGVDITEHLNDPLPLDLEFVNEDGDTVRLRDFFTGNKPVIITLNYYECPMLCNLQLNGLLGKATVPANPNRGVLGAPGSGIMGMDWDLGDKYEIITVSFDPDEGPDLAQGKRDSYINAYRREHVKDGWHFLTGTAENSRALADAIGFGYYWNEETSQWAHAAAIFLVTPEGRLSRYLYGVTYESDTLRMALLEASEGKIGNTIDKFLMWCFHYDDKTGQYTLAVMNIMRLVGFVTMVTLGVGLFILWRRDHKRRAPLAPGSAGGPNLIGARAPSTLDSSLRANPRPEAGANGNLSLAGPRSK